MAGRTEEKSSLAWAAGHGLSDLIQQLIAAGVDVDAREKDGSTPLFNAVRGNRLEAGRLLLDSGAEVNLVDLTGRTAIGYAALNGNTDQIRLLLEKSAKFDNIDSHGRSPLWLAASEGHTDAVSMFLAHNADVDVRDYSKTAKLDANGAIIKKANASRSIRTRSIEIWSHIKLK